MGIGTSYATFDEETGYTTEKNEHIGGTVSRGTSTEFWLSRPRPKGISIDEWDRLEQEKWERIWGKKEGKCVTLN